MLCVGYSRIDGSQEGPRPVNHGCVNVIKSHSFKAHWRRAEERQFITHFIHSTFILTLTIITNCVASSGVNH